MYGKVFRQMYKGSMSMAGWEAVVTLQQLIVLADRHGVVDMTPQAIAGETTIPLEIIQKGLDVLSRPDPESRTPDEDGRRIVPLSPTRSWGWQLVNYDKYRAMRDEEERREYQRQYWHKRKDSTQLNSTQRNSTHAEAEADAEVTKNVPSGRIARKRANVRKAPENFEVTPEMRQWAWNNCPAVNLEAETEAFKDYTFASGRTDWQATWRNWMRKANKNGAVRPTRYEQLMQIAAAPPPADQSPSELSQFLLGSRQ